MASVSSLLDGQSSALAQTATSTNALATPQPTVPVQQAAAPSTSAIPMDQDPTTQLLNLIMAQSQQQQQQQQQLQQQQQQQQQQQHHQQQIQQG